MKKTQTAINAEKSSKNTKNKSVLRIVLAVILVAIVVMGISACSSPEYSQQVDNRYTVEKVRTSIVVTKDSEAQITEVIDVRFLTDGRRGIIRDLPTHAGESYRGIKANQTLLDWGTKSSGKSRNTQIPNNYFVTTESGFICINTGTKDTETDYFFYAGDRVQYTFSYTITPPAKYAKSDNYYVNIVGQGWSTVQSDIEVTVKFPHAVQKAIFYYGKYGSNSSVQYSASGDSLGNPVSGDESIVSATLKDSNTLVVKSDLLAAYQGITMQCAINGKLNSPFDFKILGVIIAAIVFLGALVLLWMLKREQPVVEVVNFYPPKEGDIPLNPAELGTLIDGQCSTEDITSLIFYWAGRGHLQIHGSDDKKEEKNGKGIKLVKLVELPAGAPAYEKKMFAALFKSGNRVDIDTLKNKFYMHIAAAQHAVTHKYKGKLHKIGASVAVAAASVLLAFAGYFFYGLSIHSSLWILSGALGVIPVVVIYAAGFLRVQKLPKMKDRQKLFSLVGLGLLAVLLGVLAGLINRGSLPYGFVFPLNIAACLGGFLAPLFVKKTEFYRTKLGDILGFRNFLESAEKSRLEMLLAENPQYYYDILPYANVLGVSDIWEKKFSSLAVQPPVYYHSPLQTVFSFMLFNSLYRSMHSGIRSVAVSRPSSSGSSGGGFGGFGGGGGFSGGGFGGGGGRSR